MTVTILAVLLAIPPEGGSYRSEQQTSPRDTRPSPVRSTATIAGVVTTDEPQPRPLRRARVTLNGEGAGSGRTAITADDGSFAFDGLPPGSYGIRAQKDAYIEKSGGAVRPGSHVAIRLPRGAVITGTVVDIDGQPAQGIAVAAIARRVDGRWGDVRYVDAGVPVPSDDRGTYRIYGLPAGEYVVSARPGEPNGPGAVNPRAVTTMVRGAPARRALIPAQVFFSSTTDLARAASVVVRAGDERSGVDLQLQYVPLSSVSGTAVTAPGWTPAEVAILRTGDTRGSVSRSERRADADGRFSISNVAPGRYLIAARSADQDGAMSIATADVTVDGEDVENVVLSLQPALTIGGLIVFRGDSRPPVVGTSTASPPPLWMLLNGSAAQATAMQIDGVRFTIEGLPAGPFRAGRNLLGVTRPLGGWWLQSIVAGGVELLDAPLDVRQSVQDAVAVFADRASEISGRLTTAAGAVVAATTVVVFSADRAAWFHGSRRIAGITTGSDGRYTIRNLPPGDYRIAVASDLEPFDWFDPAVLERLMPGATRVTIAGAGTQTLDLVVR